MRAISTIFIILREQSAMGNGWKKKFLKLMKYLLAVAFDLNCIRCLSTHFAKSSVTHLHQTII